MKKTVKSVLALLLCVSLCAGLIMPAYAANGKGITFSVSAPALETKDEEQIVAVTLTANGSFEADSIEFKVVVPVGWSIASVVGDGITYNYNSNNLMYNWYDVSAENVEFTSTIATITYTVPANADDAVVGVTGLAITSDYGTTWEDGVDVTTTVNINDAPAVQGYTAGVNTTGSTVTVGNPVTVNVGVSHSEDPTFNAAEVVLTYNPAYLTLDTDSVKDWQYTDVDGTLTIEDFGTDKNFSTSNYAVTFDTVQVGETTVTLTDAAFINKEGATTNDLIDATLNPASVNISIQEVTYTVTLPGDGMITGKSVATKGQDYTFTVDEPSNYTYTMTVTVGGNEINTFTGPDANGKYTIPGTSVNDNIVITYTRVAKSYDVTVDGNEQDQLVKVILPAEKPTYKVDYTFTIPENVLPTTDSKGYNYTVTVSVNGEDYSPVVNGFDYTVRGVDITGDILIYLETEVLDETPIPQVTVGITGSTDVKVNGKDSVTVNKDSEVTLTLTREDGYNYSVVVGSGDPVTFDNNNEYKFTASTDVTVTVTKTLDTSSVAVTQYVKVNNYVVWLVTFDPTLDGKVPTYDGNVMYWSEKYDAYCWLEVNATLSVDDAKDKMSAQTGVAGDKAVDYGMDINGTGVTDAADAQIVWNMYNAMYNDNFTSVKMAQFLAADQNAVSDNNSTWKLTVQDAQVIIAAILDGTATV